MLLPFEGQKPGVLLFSVNWRCTYGNGNLIDSESPVGSNERLCSVSQFTSKRTIILVPPSVYVFFFLKLLSSLKTSAAMIPFFLVLCMLKLGIFGD